MKNFLVRTTFLFALICLPTFGLAPSNNSYGVSDFFAYYTQVQLIKERRLDMIYDVEKMQTATEEQFPPVKGKIVVLVAEPPLSTIFFMPIGILPKDSALIITKIFLVLCVSAAVTLFASIFQLSERRFQLTGILVAMSGPLWEAMRVTKPAVLVLLGLACAMWLLHRRRHTVAPLFFLPWVLRPQLSAPFLLQLLCAKQWKFILGVAATTFVLLLLTLPMVGMENYINWTHVLKYADTHPVLNRPDLQATLHGQLLHAFVFIPAIQKFLSLEAIKVISIAGSIFAVATLMVFGYMSRNSGKSLKLALLGFPLSLVSAYYCHNYDLLLLIPAVLTFFSLSSLKELSRKRRRALIVFAAICILPFELPFYIMIHYWGLQLGLPINPLFVSLVAMSVLFLVMGFRESKMKGPLEGHES